MLVSFTILILANAILCSYSAGAAFRLRKESGRVQYTWIGGKFRNLVTT